MEGKLIKSTGNHFDLRTNEGLYTSTYQWTNRGNILYRKNCQAIELGYDLEELCEKYSIQLTNDAGEDLYTQNELDFGYLSFKAGFEKALETLNHNKYSQGDILNAIYKARQVKDGDELFDVEDVFGLTELCTHCFSHAYDGSDIIQSLQQTEWYVTFNPDEKDSEGNLILKRKV